MNNEKYNHAVSPQIILRVTCVSGCSTVSHTVLTVFMLTSVNALAVGFQVKQECGLPKLSSQAEAQSMESQGCSCTGQRAQVFQPCSFALSAWFAHTMCSWDYTKANTRLQTITGGAH